MVLNSLFLGHPRYLHWTGPRLPGREASKTSRDQCIVHIRIGRLFSKLPSRPARDKSNAYIKGSHTCWT